MIVTISFFDIVLLVLIGIVLVIFVIGLISSKISNSISSRPKYIAVEPPEPPEWVKRDEAIKAEKARLKALKASDRDAYRKETAVRRHFLIFISIFGIIFAGLIAALILTHIQK